MGEEVVPRVPFTGGFRRRRLELEDAGRGEPPHELLQGPAVLPQRRRQVIEEGGVRGQLAHLPEVVRRGDDAAAEGVGPEPVRDDAGGERVTGVENAVGQGKPRVDRLGVGFGGRSLRGSAGAPARQAAGGCPAPSAADRSAGRRAPRGSGSARGSPPRVAGSRQRSDALPARRPRCSAAGRGARSSPGSGAWASVIEPSRQASAPPRTASP